MRKRRAVTVFLIGTILLILLGGAMPEIVNESFPRRDSVVAPPPVPAPTGDAAEALQKLIVKGRAPKTGYDRDLFGDGWSFVNGCTTRNIILHRDLQAVVLDDECTVISGLLNDPYTSDTIPFSREDSSAVQIDHVVALSDAWQKGAQELTQEQREQFANDPLELLAVSGAQNQAKSDSDAASWLPKNRAFRCDYIARQIAVKTKYVLWVTQAEKEAMVSVLSSCPGQLLPTP